MQAHPIHRIRSGGYAGPGRHHRRRARSVELHLDGAAVVTLLHRQLEGIIAAAVVECADVGEAGQLADRDGAVVVFWPAGEGVEEVDAGEVVVEDRGWGCRVGG